MGTTRASEAKRAEEMRATARAVGARIRTLRSVRGVGLSELARHSGIGKGTLSELERGQRNPTLETLFAITTALDAPLSELLIDHGVPGNAPRAHGISVDARLLDRWEHEGITEVYDIRLGRHRQESEPHSPGVRETLTILTGRAEAGTTSSPDILTPGQSMTFAGDDAHVYQGLEENTRGILIMRYPPTVRPAHDTPEVAPRSRKT